MMFKKFQWTLRNPICINPDSRTAFLTPVLEVGIKGIEKPFVELDFACDNFEDDENDAMGWRFGWFGGDIMNPKIERVWRASGYAINSVRGSVLEYSIKGSPLKCTNIAVSPVPPTLFIPAAGFFVFTVIVSLFCVLSRYEKYAKRRERRKNYKYETRKF